jgi:diaminohydroxyphosphoribosylaminopyrimidine deaminase/5-amino-6-(5-phosphoribosylamino)uracil reductase
VIVDSQLRTPVDANILKDGKVLIVYTQGNEAQKSALSAAGAELLQIGSAGKVCLNSLLSALAERGINELMVEAGQTLNGGLLAANLVDELVLYYAPIILGADARGMLAIPPLKSMQDCVSLHIIETRQIGQDIRVRAQAIYQR